MAMASFPILFPDFDYRKACGNYGLRYVPASATSFIVKGSDEDIRRFASEMSLTPIETAYDSPDAHNMVHVAITYRPTTGEYHMTRVPDDMTYEPLENHIPDNALRAHVSWIPLEDYLEYQAHCEDCQKWADHMRDLLEGTRERK